MIETLGDFLEVVDGLLVSPKDVFWFRGQSDATWRLTPAALRPNTEGLHQAALDLLAEFKKLAVTKLPQPPPLNDDLQWLGIAQHYGLPTRMLDWTENPAIALYFACHRQTKHGALYLVNPVSLNRAAASRLSRVLSHQDHNLVAPYLTLGPKTSSRGKRTVAISPVYNSERILIQRGAFTIHGSRSRFLDEEHGSSIVRLPILKNHKPRLLSDLERIGVDEMAIFPEPEHLCRHLKRSVGLDV